MWFLEDDRGGDEEEGKVLRKMRMDGGDFGLWLDRRWRLEGLSCVEFSEGLGCDLRRSEESTRGVI